MKQMFRFSRVTDWSSANTYNS